MKNRVREFRKKLGCRQEELASKMNVTRQTISAIENNKYNPTLELAMKLARFLEISVEELFLLDD